MFDSHDSCITKLLCLRGTFSLISHENLNRKIEKLQSICELVASQERDNHLFNKQCFQCLKKLIQIIQTSSRSQLQSLPPYDITKSSITILSLYDDCWFYNTDARWKIIRKYEVAMVCYRTLLKTFSPVNPTEMADAIFNSIIQLKLWQIEDLCEAIILDMLKFNIAGSIIAEKLSGKIETNILEVDSARNLVGLLDNFLKIYKWPDDMRTDIFIDRLLALYHHILNNFNENTNALKKGVETNIKHLVQHLENGSLLTVIKYMSQWIVNNNNLDDAEVLNYGILMEYTACKHKTDLYTKTLTPEILPLILRMIASSNRLISLLGNRVLQYLIDRNKNRTFFSTPRIFLEDAKFDIKIPECHYEDKIFIKSQREVIHDSIMKSVVNHCSTCLNLETSYCTMCLIAVEIPCGFTTASLVCLAMNMQNLMLEEQNAPQETAFHIHATVVSIMSLLCWIHEAKVFYEYVNKIILKRAHWAPHLNPPLQTRYEHAAHHVLWNKPELFFVDWEVRYGLWKRFRLKNEDRKLSTSAD